MANIEKVSGVFGGIKTDEPIQNCGNNGIGIENAININGENTINNSSTGTNLPAKNTSVSYTHLTLPTNREV